jgi:DNA-binding response OmpR family regulator
LKPAAVASKLPTRILVVEDDPAVYKPIQLLLTHYGFDVTVASTLKDGRQQCMGKPDLIVLDLMLPDGSGLELLEKIRMAGQSTAVFVLTGNLEAEIDRKVRRLLPNRHFRKPFIFFDILRAVQEIFPAPTSETTAFVSAIN